MILEHLVVPERKNVLRKDLFIFWPAVNIPQKNPPWTSKKTKFAGLKNNYFLNVFFLFSEVDMVFARVELLRQSPPR